MRARAYAIALTCKVERTYVRIYIHTYIHDCMRGAVHDRSGTLWSGLRLWIMDRTCIGIIVLYHWVDIIQCDSSECKQ